MKETLWTRDFTIITIGTIISAIGGTAMQFAMSVVVYAETSSTWLTGIYSAVSMLPLVMLPLLAAPLIDRYARKKVIVFLDYLLGFVFLLVGMLFLKIGFVYSVYLLLGIMINSVGVVYSLAYDALYPELIPKGFTQKGYSISTLIYPMATALMTPVAALIYNYFGVEIIFFLEGVLLLIAATFETQIQLTESHVQTQKSNTLKNFFEDISQAFNYLCHEKGLLYINLYMLVGTFAAEGFNLMVLAFFSTSLIYNLNHYSLLSTAEMCGRTVGGMLHYKLEIPSDKRYAIASKVYVIYELCDGLLLFVMFPVMLVLRFFVGILGVNSANIRLSSTMKYIPSEMRARVNSFFTIMTFFGAIAAKLLAGYLGEIFPAQWVVVFFSACALLAAIFFILTKRRDISLIYNVEL